ncbi:MAG: ribosomal RNA small subunit methyltransferase A [Proteobacteria bacterium]|nr:ribosomal RNA small subunit methyltransferase A [Pseudomonadota bacterium]
MSKKKPFARKRFGQNFLQDSGIKKSILQSADLQSGDHVLEIGPGRGSITESILHSGVRLTVVEIDRDLVIHLRKRFQVFPEFKLIEGDILALDWLQLFINGEKTKLIANLPYNISTPLFFKFVQYRDYFDSITIMVQKELALRLFHDGGGKNLKDYGVLSVIARNIFDVEWICDVSPASFVPIPKVDSAVIRMTPKQVKITHEEDFYNFVKKSFNQRRKKYLGCLKKWDLEFYNRLDEVTLNFLKDKRPENISPIQFLKLFQENQTFR